jgi:hypothetical protein
MNLTLELVIVLVLYLLLFLVPYRVAIRMNRKKSKRVAPSALSSRVIDDFFAGKVKWVTVYSSHGMVFSHIHCSVYVNMLDKTMLMIFSDTARLREPLSIRNERRFLKYLNENQ